MNILQKNGKAINVFYKYPIIKNFSNINKLEIGNNNLSFLKRLFEQRKNKIKERENEFLIENRREILSLYRQIFKLTSYSISSKIEREARQEEFRYLFRICQQETDVNQI